MPLITREEKGSKLTIQEMDGNLTYLNTLANAGGAIDILTEYPITDASKAGQRFWYLSYEWHYMTQPEIDAIGWDVAEGFPAPVNKVNNLYIQAPTTGSTYFDFLGMGRPDIFLWPSGYYISNQLFYNTITSFKNANLLTAMKDYGTNSSLVISSLTISSNVLNDFFTQLPITSNTSTIRIQSVSGGASCDPTIATAKGYTVVIS